MILAVFVFLFVRDWQKEQNVPAVTFVCPQQSWVDCMPGPGVQNPQCKQEYIFWAYENCPGFKGAAL